MRSITIVDALVLIFLFAGATSLPADDAPLPQPTRQELLDPAWIEATLAEIGIDRLIKLYDADEDAAPDPAVQLVQDALMLSRKFLPEHPVELRSQLQARLLSSDEPDLQVFQDLPADRVRARATRPSLHQAGGAHRVVIPLNDQAGEIVASPSGEMFAFRQARTKAGPPFQGVQGIEVRSRSTGELLAYLSLDNEQFITPAGISPDGTKAFAVTVDGVIHAWNVQTEEILWNGVCGNSQQMRATCAYSPDQTLVAVSIFGRQIVVFDIETGEECSVLNADGVDYIGNIAFLDDDTLVGCCIDGVLRHWSISTGEVLEELEVSAGWLTHDGTRALAFSGKSDTGWWECTGFDLIDTSTGESVQHVDFDKPLRMHCAGWDLTGENVVICTHPTEPPRLVGYSVSTGEKTIDVAVPGHGFIDFVALAGGCIAASPFENEVTLWDLSRAPVEADALVLVSDVGLSADGAVAMTGSTYQYEVQLWDTSTWRQTATFEVPRGRKHATMSDDGSRIAYCLGNEVHVIDVATGQSALVHKFEQDARIDAFEMSGDGQVGAATLRQDKTYVIDMNNGDLLNSTARSPEVSLSYDGSRLLLGRRLLDRDAGHETEFENVFGGMSAISADGTLGVIYGILSCNVVWNLDTGAIIKDAAHVEDVAWMIHKDAPVAISGNGRFSVSCDFDQHVYLYDIRAGRQLAVVATDASGVSAVEISEDGSHLLIGTTSGVFHHYRFENLPP